MTERKARAKTKAKAKTKARARAGFLFLFGSAFFCQEVQGFAPPYVIENKVDIDAC
jgi:hypothetical protein